MKINWFKIEKHEILTNIEKFIEFRVLTHYISFLTYLKQGEYCEDCEKYYRSCKCNFCDICSSRYCLCNLNIKIEKSYMIDYLNNKIYIEIRNKLIYFMKYNLSISYISFIVFKLKVDFNCIATTNDEKEDLKYLIETLDEYENKLV